MKYLYVDIASHTAQLVLVEDDQVVVRDAKEEKISDHVLIPWVEDVLAQAKWTYEDLTHIACVVGPGGFTSLRIAVAFANTLVDQLDVVGAGIHLSDKFESEKCANAKMCKCEKSPLLWLHSTKRNELFARSLVGDKWPEAVLLTLEEFKEQVPKDALWCGELIEEHQIIIESLSLPHFHTSTLAHFEWLPQLLQSSTYSKDLIQPWYGREG